MAIEDTPPPILNAPLLPLHGPINQETPTTFFTAITSILNLKNFYVILGPLLSIIICFLVKLDAPSTSTKMLGVIAWVFTWWITEAVPLPITSMCPLFLFPLFGIASADSVAHSYMDDVIALILGTFILALAVERYNVHRRLALNVSINSKFIFCSTCLCLIITEVYINLSSLECSHDLLLIHLYFLLLKYFDIFTLKEIN